MTTANPKRRALAGVLSHASLLGLPSPRRVDLDSANVPVLSFATINDLQAWVEHADHPVSDNAGRLECSTTFLDLDVRLVAAAEVRS